LTARSRVLIVDDSAPIRRLLDLALGAEADIEVVVFSSLTERGAAATIEALCAGAADYLCKPAELGGPKEAVEWLRRTLVPKLRALAAPARVRPALTTSAPAPALASRRPHVSASCIVALAPSPVVRAVVIGASVGGPPALSQVLSALSARTALPVLIVQHMAAVFTRALAARLALLTKIPVHEAEHGMPIQPGHAYVAAGDHHLKLIELAAGPHLALDRGPLENGCRPAVDVLFRSAAALYGPGLLAIVLTGTGADGTKGALAVRGAGGRVWAQDEASSTAWGMPGSVIQHGYADSVKPLSALGRELARTIEPRVSSDPWGRSA